MAVRLPIRSWPGILFGILVILLALGNSWLGLYPYGQAVWIRPLFALTGIIGAIGLLRGNSWWRILLPVWCLLQSWIIATDVSGEWFYQGLMLGAKMEESSRSTINELVTAYEAHGASTTGIILLAILLLIAICRLHPPVCRHPTPKGIAWAFGAVIALGAGVALAYWPNGRDAWVLDLDLPHVPIYYKDQMLGRTPLHITPERVRQWKLPLDVTRSLTLDGSGWADCAVLSDGTARLPLYAAAPWPFGGYVETFDSPWGERCRVDVGTLRDKFCSGFAYPQAALRHEPMLTIRMLDPQPLAPGAALRLHCDLKNRGEKSYAGRKATLTRVCYDFERRDKHAWSKAAGTIRSEVTMPVTWNSLPTGGAMAADVEFDTPTVPGNYEIFCMWFLYVPDERSNTGAGSTYSNVLCMRVK